jgi:phosphoribosylanthranilate isomerase
MIEVKICGMNSEAGFDASIEAAADYIGFVFFQRSPRFVTSRQAASLSARQAGGPRRVGLFVLPELAEIEAVLDAMELDVLQIYGDAASCLNTAETFKLPVWRPVGVKSAADLPQEKGPEAALVIESAAPANASRPGGNAIAMDWAILSSWNAPAPWLLAGGLTADNVAEAIIKSGALAVDVSSGVETLPGVKSPALIKRFIGNARAAAVNSRSAARLA